MKTSTTLARLQCSEPVARRLADVLGDSLPGGGTVCSAFEDTPGRWAVEVHFAAPPNEAALRALVKVAAGDEAAKALTFATVQAKDWVAASLAGLPPVRAGRFIVHGAHDRASIPANAIGIEIEAALAFGTGHHGTTRGCLLALDGIAKRRRPRKILDIGTGTGVLAMAAAKLLHRHVVATDIDPVAVKVASENARLNRTHNLVGFIVAAGVPPRLHGGYDLIFANILLPPLQRMASPLTRILAPHGRVILSGLLGSHAHAALVGYRAQGLSLERRIPIDEWVTLVMRRSRP